MSGARGLACLAVAVALTACVDPHSPRVTTLERVIPNTPKTLMTTSAQVREKLIGTTIRQPRSNGRLALLESGGKGQIWNSGFPARLEAVDWTIKNGAQAGMGAPPEMWFVCLDYPPSEQRPRGGEQCTQADLWQVAEGERPPA